MSTPPSVRSPSLPDKFEPLDYSGQPDMSSVLVCTYTHMSMRGRPVGGHGLTGFIYVPRDPVGTFANKLRVNVLGIGSKDGLVTRVSEPLKVEPNRPRKG